MVTLKSTAPANSANLSATELELKRRGRRRLIGALTMGLLAIVFLPMIFDSEPKKNKANTQEIAIQVPPKEGLAPLTAPVMTAAVPVPATVPDAAVAASPALAASPNVKAEPKPASVPLAAAPVQAVAVPTPTLSPAPTTVVPPPKPAVVESPKKPAIETKPAPIPAPITVPTPPPIALKTGFAVQIGAFKDAAKVQELVAQMKQAKRPVFTDQVPVASGIITRVRIGPFATREKADSALAEIKLSGSDGKIVPLN